MSNQAWCERRYGWTRVKRERRMKRWDKDVRIGKSRRILNGLDWKRELGHCAEKPLIHNGRKP